MDHTSAGIAQWRWMCLGDTHSVARRVRADISGTQRSAAHIPSRLEPTGLLRSDGKRPDGVTLAPWSSGCLLVWYATCPDTFAISYRAQATSEAGRVAESAEDRKAEGQEGREVPWSPGEPQFHPCCHRDFGSDRAQIHAFPEGPRT